MFAALAFWLVAILCLDQSSHRDVVKPMGKVVVYRPTLFSLSQAMKMMHLVRKQYIFQSYLPIALYTFLTKLLPRRIAEEKFAKMREVYQKLRDEHVSLIRSVSDGEKQGEGWAIVSFSLWM